MIFLSDIVNDSVAINFVQVLFGSNVKIAVQDPSYPVSDIFPYNTFQEILATFPLMCYMKFADEKPILPLGLMYLMPIHICKC